MYLTIVILPLLASIISGFYGRKVGVTGAHVISCLSLSISLILTIIAMINLLNTDMVTSIRLFDWWNSEIYNINWEFTFDALTISMLIPVLLVSLLVHIYSISYMEHDWHQQRFFSYLSLFTFLMIILVVANNYLLMFVGWEGIGICSYLLVNFWFTRQQANKSAMAAIFYNRVGDTFLTIGIISLLWIFGNADYASVYALAPYINPEIITLVTILLLLGAMAKSAQLPLHVWLPQAMEGWLGLSLNFTICGNLLMKSWSSVNFTNFGKIQDEGQSAGNNDYVIGSSETTRETMKLNEDFKWWFIGFAEGDGSFIVNKNGYLEFKLTQSSIDVQVLFYVKKNWDLVLCVCKIKIIKLIITGLEIKIIY